MPMTLIHLNDSESRRLGDLARKLGYRDTNMVARVSRLLLLTGLADIEEKLEEEEDVLEAILAEVSGHEGHVHLDFSTRRQEDPETENPTD